jgi:16S rRNA (guanine527-N7)-methyltransferase
VESARIAELLRPFLGEEELSTTQLQQLSSYLELLLRWNAKTNLTAIREPEEIVRRHFGESLFLARKVGREARTALDIGSGAGFPGIPLKICSPHIAVTLIESHNKKATFLKEVVRGLTLTNIDILSGRAQSAGLRAHLVTLRAVEKFEEILPVAADLLNGQGELALLIGAGQVEAAKRLLPKFGVQSEAVPESRERMLLLARWNHK